MNTRFFALAAGLGLAGCVATFPAHAEIVGPPSAQTPQQTVDQLVQEPLRYDGTATGASAFGHTLWEDNRAPSRILIGLHPRAPDDTTHLSGEFIALDPQNRPVASGPITGSLETPGGMNQSATACHLKAQLHSELDLDGVCSATVLSGTFHIPQTRLVKAAIAIGAATPPITASQYWLGPMK